MFTMRNSPQVDLRRGFPLPFFIPHLKVNVQKSFVFGGFPQQLARKFVWFRAWNETHVSFNFKLKAHVIEEWVFSLWKQPYMYLITISQR